MLLDYTPYKKSDYKYFYHMNVQQKDVNKQQSQHYNVHWGALEEKMSFDIISTSQMQHE